MRELDKVTTDSSIHTIDDKGSIYANMYRITFVWWNNQSNLSTDYSINIEDWVTMDSLPNLDRVSVNINTTDYLVTDPVCKFCNLNNNSSYNLIAPNTKLLNLDVVSNFSITLGYWCFLDGNIDGIMVNIWDSSSLVINETNYYSYSMPALFYCSSSCTGWLVYVSYVGNSLPIISNFVNLWVPPYISSVTDYLHTTNLTIIDWNQSLWKILTSDINWLASWADLDMYSYELKSDMIIDVPANETDPVFTASEAYNITSSDITHLDNLTWTNTGDQIADWITITGTGTISAPFAVIWWWWGDRTPQWFTTATVWEIPAWTDLWTEEIPVNTTLNQMLYAIKYPTYTGPTYSLTSNQPSLQEIGSVVTLILTYPFTNTLWRWSINGSLVWGIWVPSSFQDYRAWMPTDYIINWVSSSYPTNSLTISWYTVLATQTFSWTVAHLIWPTPKDSSGEDVLSPWPLPAVPLPATANIRSTTFVATYPYFGTSVDLTTLTKQSLVVLAGPYFQVNMVAEDDVDKQKADFKTTDIVITGVQFYNTVSSAWERLWWTKVNSMTHRTQSSVTKIVQWNILTYTRFTHNQAKIGARQLRFYL